MTNETKPNPPERVPHVRPGVRGTKTVGRSPFERFSLDARDTFPERAVQTKVKAFEDIRFRPMYAEANMGHPSRTFEYGFGYLWHVVHDAMRNPLCGHKRESDEGKRDLDCF
jgi:hypothetical protein